MPRRIEDPWRKMRDGNVVLKMRKGSSYWQAHLKVRGEWLRLSTGTSDLRQAAQWACDQYDDMMYRVRHKQVPRTKLVRDATAQYLKELEKLTAVLENVLDGIVRTDAYGTIQRTNQAAERIFGYEKGELLGQNVRILMPEPDRSRHDGYMAAHQIGKQTSVIGKGRELEGVTKDGRRFPLELTVTETTAGGQRMFIGVVRDITERQLAQEQLRRLAETDALTGLPNRGKFDRILVDEWQRHTRVGDHFSLILLDVDHFKQFNDTYGHQAGDTCLQAVAGAIRSAVIRTTDFAARYGGEEFVCVLPATSSEGAVLIAERIRDAVANLGIPHARSTAADHVTVSLGVISFGADASTSVTEALAMADRLLYQAKKSGRNRWVAKRIGEGDATPGVEGGDVQD